MCEVEIAVGGLERARETQKGANGTEADEIQLRQIDRHGFACRSSSLLGCGREFVACVRVHSSVRSSDQALAVLREMELRDVQAAPPSPR